MSTILMQKKSQRTQCSIIYGYNELKSNIKTFRFAVTPVIGQIFQRFFSNFLFIPIQIQLYQLNQTNITALPRLRCDANEFNIPKTQFIICSSENLDKNSYNCDSEGMSSILANLRSSSRSFNSLRT